MVANGDWLIFSTILIVWSESTGEKKKKGKEEREGKRAISTMGPSPSSFSTYSLKTRAEDWPQKKGKKKRKKSINARRITSSSPSHQGEKGKKRKRHSTSFIDDLSAGGKKKKKKRRRERKRVRKGSLAATMFPTNPPRGEKKKKGGEERIRERSSFPQDRLKTGKEKKEKEGKVRR